MKRESLFSIYETPQGKLLQRLEERYLKRYITVSYNQSILQIGVLGWENKYIDSSLYSKYCILDIKGENNRGSVKIFGKSNQLPIQSEMVDLIILPHLLEFDANRFQTMREIERILKPEGEVIILNFNPLSIWVRLQFLWNIKMSNSWRGYFINRSRVADWLKLLNFEIKTTSEFTIDSTITTPEQFKFSRHALFSMAYAVRAVKRQYTLIPLTPLKIKPSRLIAVSSAVESSTHRVKEHD